MSKQDSQNPYAAVGANDKGMELVNEVMSWYRGNRNVLSAAQQTAVITAITGILNGTLRV